MYDLHDRKDIEYIVREFYAKALKDPHIAHFFITVSPIDLDIHLPLICDFWESTILAARNYQGNPMIKHIALNEKYKMLPSHFGRWLYLWRETVKDRYEGGNADLIVKRAEEIAELMKYKITQAEKL